MSFERIWAVVLRYLYATRDPSRITEFIFWPMIDIGFLGLMAFWVGNLSGIPTIVTKIVTGLVLWQLIYRANYEICVNIMDEFWESNLLNLLSTPLTKTEWVMAMMLSGLLKISFTFLFGAAVGWMFFSVNIFSVGWTLVPFVFLCLFSGWMTGFLGASLLIFKGSKFGQLPWVTITLAALFSTIYYPIETLPTWMQFISLSLPMSYIFEGMREILSTGSISSYYLIMAFILSVVYLMLAIRCFLFMFEKSRQRGLGRLT